MFNLTHVKFPTHREGHTIDVVLTHGNSPIIEDIKSIDANLSDHFIIQFKTCDIIPEKKEYRNATYRNTKLTCNDSFSKEIQ